jgi:hypothetical protein
MGTHRPRFPYLPSLIAGIAVILSSSAGIAGIMGWLPALTSGSADISAPDGVPVASATPVAVAPRVQSEARARARCAECGVVVSMREIDVHDEGAGHDTSGGAAPARRYETTIRMADQSSRVIRDGSLASWRVGEHVIVIDGAKSSNR